jgi:glycosyltransferase involved in cell wall biosynthesis
MNTFARTGNRADWHSVRPLVRNRPTGIHEPSVSVVIPTLNEARNLGHVLERIPDWVTELIIVDGLSEDDTVEVALAFRQDARVLEVTQRGKGHALRAGFEAATGDIVVALDGDGSMDPGELPAFVGALIAGADVALGSRFAVGGGTKDMELHRRLGNHVLRGVVDAAFGARYTDLCYGYMAFWRDVLPALDAPHEGFEVETLVHIRARQKRLLVAEVPSFESRRMSGVSNLRTFHDGAVVLKTILRERWRDRRLRFGIGEMQGRPVANPPWMTRQPEIDLAQVESEQGA